MSFLNYVNKFKWLIVVYLLCVGFFAYEAYTDPLEAEAIEELFGMLPLLIGVFLGFVLVLLAVYKVTQCALSKTIPSIKERLTESSKDSALLKTKQLYDAGVLTEDEYKERLARIKAR